MKLLYVCHWQDGGPFDIVVANILFEPLLHEYTPYSIYLRGTLLEFNSLQ